MKIYLLTLKYIYNEKANQNHTCIIVHINGGRMYNNRSRTIWYSAILYQQFKRIKVLLCSGYNPSVTINNGLSDTLIIDPNINLLIHESGGGNFPAQGLIPEPFICDNPFTSEINDTLVNI